MWLRNPFVLIVAEFGTLNSKGLCSRLNCFPIWDPLKS